MSNWVQYVDPKTGATKSVREGSDTPEGYTALTSSMTDSSSGVTKLSSVRDEVDYDATKYADDKTVDYDSSSKSSSSSSSNKTTSSKTTTTTPVVSDQSTITASGNGLATGQTSTDNDTMLTTDAEFRASELIRANAVIAERQAAGLDISEQEAYIAKINAINNGGSTGSETTDAYLAEIKARANAGEDVTATGEVNANGVTQTDAMTQVLELIAENQRNQTEALTAAEEAKFKAQEAALDKAYAQAEADAETERTQAEADLTSQEALVDENRYAESEASKVSAENRGIGNSAQFEALNRGTLSRAGAQKLEAAQIRDQTLSDISTRINNLSLQKDLDVVAAEADKDYNIASGTASIASDAFGQQLSQIQTEQGYDFQQAMQDDAQAFTASESQIGRDWTSAENQIGYDQQTSERIASEIFTASQAETSMLFSKMMQDDSQAFSAAQQSASQNYQSATIANANARADALSAKALADEYAMYTDEDSELYKIRVAQGEDAADTLLKELEIQSEASLNARVAEDIYQSEWDDNLTDFELMESDTKDEYQMLWYQAAEVASGYVTGDDGITKTTLTPEQQQVELRAITNAMRGNAYLEPYSDAQDKLGNYISGLSYAIEEGQIDVTNTIDMTPVGIETNSEYFNNIFSSAIYPGLTGNKP